MFDIKTLPAALIAEVLNVDAEEITSLLTCPPDDSMGDVAMPCFKFAKLLRKSPVVIAQELADAINAQAQRLNDGGFARAEALNGYLNFYLDRNLFVEKVVREVLAEESYGSSTEGSGKTIVMDYSAPNIAKPFHIGHLPSTVIGNAMYRVFSYLGYNCVGVNHLGDWGTQFGTLIVAYKRWGSKEEVEKGGVRELVRLYVKFHAEEENEPSLRDEARAAFARIEAGSEEELNLWRWFHEISLAEFNRVYEKLGVKFDYFTGESFYNDKMDAVVEELRSKNLLTLSEGAYIVDLENEKMPPCIILKSDGSTLYATRDITAAIYRKKTFDFHKCIYFTASAQNLHFKQWFKVVEKMGYDWAKDLVHAPFGMISLEGGVSMSTRKGVTVWLDDVLEQAEAKTLDIINEKNPALEDKELVARQMGVGAVIFGMLDTARIKDVAFSWDEALNFDGETGPYAQYTYARCKSILRRAGDIDFNSITDVNYTTDSEYRLARLLYEFPAKVVLCARDYEPCVVARHLIDVAQAFNRFYNECPILSAKDEKTKNSRLLLADATSRVLKQCLWLLGLAAPERV
ncbi:MAG: arginine--tRNA ligase [Clostridiales bacterium]|nr:arginine--tRNA ligase [Clostridiales bacterium]